MTIKKSLTRLLALAISLGLVAMPLAAQKPKEAQTAPKTAARPPQDAATFENLMAADDYKIFGEIKNVGQLIRSPNVTEVLEPVIKLANPPREFRSLVKFANVHAEVLQTARMFFATWPARTKIPQTLLAIEFSSTEEAAKFEPQLREFLPTILPPPTPSPTPDPAAADIARPALPVAATITVDPALTPIERQKLAESKSPDNGAEQTTAKTSSSPEVTQSPVDVKPAALPFAIKLMGNLVLISDTPFNAASLRPKNSEALFDNPNFRQARDRFGSEQIFVFVNIALDERQRLAAAEADASLPIKHETVSVEVPPVRIAVDRPQPVDEAAAAQPVEPQGEPENETPDTRDPGNVDQPEIPDRQNSPTPGETAPQPDIDLAMGLIFGNLFGGTPKNPDAVGIAISLDSDTYAARVLLIGGPDGKASPVPIISQWVSGPALTFESPSILPAETELFIAASLDAPQIYEGLLKTINEQSVRYQQTSGQPHNDAPPVTPFAALEKSLGLKIKEDVLPILGNEVAVSVPVNTFTGGASTPAPNAARDEKDPAKDKKSSSSPVVLISLKDKEAAHTLLPKIIEGLGFKGAAMLAQKERRDDTEIVSYAGAFAYAFVGNFLVLSTDAASTRHVVDSYLAHQTLGSDSQFRNATRWQPRQLLGQVYMSPVLMESYRTYANNPTALVNDKVRDFLTRLSPMSEPVTYSLSSDGMGPLHELHIPRNLVLMVVAGISSEANQSPLIRNEQITRSGMTMLANSEKAYHQGPGKGHYASFEQLADQQMVSKEMFRENGYRFEISINGDKFTVTAVPNEYNKTGRLSYFIDETEVLRGGDHGGAPATVADGPVQ